MKKLNEIYNEETKSTREYHYLFNEINYGFEKFQDDFKHKKKRLQNLVKLKLKINSLIKALIIPFLINFLVFFTSLTSLGTFLIIELSKSLNDIETELSR